MSPAKKRKIDISIADFALRERAAIDLARGADPLDVYEYAPDQAFDRETEHLAEIFRDVFRRRAERARGSRERKF